MEGDGILHIKFMHTSVQGNGADAVESSEIRGRQIVT